MIQVKCCQFCNKKMEVYKLQIHHKQCSSKQREDKGKRQLPSKYSIQTEAQRQFGNYGKINKVKFELDVNISVSMSTGDSMHKQIRSYAIAYKIQQQIYKQNQLQKLFQQLFPQNAGVQNFNLILDPAQSYIQIYFTQQQQAKQDLLHEKQNLLDNSQLDGKCNISQVLHQNEDKIKFKIEEIVNSYHVAMFTIDPLYIQYLNQLADQYVFLTSSQSGRQDIGSYVDICFIEQKSCILQRIIQFFKDVMAMHTKMIQSTQMRKSQYQNRLQSELSSQILQYQYRHQHEAEHNQNRIKNQHIPQQQAIQFENQKQKQLQKTLKSINTFISNPNQVSIKLRKTHNKYYIFICGVKQMVSTCKQYLQQFIRNSNEDNMNDGANISKRYRIQQQEYKLLKSLKILQKYKSQYGIRCDVKEISISRMINVNQSSSLCLLLNPSILSIPKSSVIILSQVMMKEINELQNSVSFLKDYVFFSDSSQIQMQKMGQQQQMPKERSELGRIKNAFKQFIDYYIDKKGQIALILPKQKPEKEQMIKQTIEILKKNSNKQLKVYLLQRNNQKSAIQALQNYMSKQRKWFATIDRTRKYYPEAVTRKLETAMANDINYVTVTDRQLNISKPTHYYDFNLGAIIHKKTSTETLVQDQGQTLIVYLQDNIYQIKKNQEINVPVNNTYIKGRKKERLIIKPQQKMQKQLTFAVYEIDISKRTQRNIITNKIYSIGYDVVKRQKSQGFEGMSGVEGQTSQIEISIKFINQQIIQQIWQTILLQLNKHKLRKSFPIQGLNQQKLQLIKNWCRLNKIKLSVVAPQSHQFSIQQQYPHESLKKQKELVAFSYYESSINNLQKLIEFHKKSIFSTKVQYPKYWMADQEEELKLYEINPQSQQFQMVERQFKISKIKKLQRIQNKILFEKYHNERQFLSSQNQNKEKVRQLMMYHGTRANKPQLIYADRQESFNINYANQGSYGKGIYFAKNSSYSNNYCYTSFGVGAVHIRQMFYCLVLAGKSEVYNGKQILDTSYRIPQKKIRYQSVVSHVNQEILVVFKNRRAYPLYLISY